MENRTKELIRTAAAVLEEKKGKDLVVLDISRVTVIADYFMIVSGQNERQVEALSDAVDEALGRAGFERRSIEGYGSKRWILMDYNDVIIHIFAQADREFYDLERIWRDGVRLDPDALLSDETAGEKE